jgi:transcriptional regulator with XRE-family HTH domain
MQPCKPTPDSLAAARARLAERMTLLRQGTQMSQRDAAARASMDRRHWRRLEQAQSNPTLDTLLSIQYALGVDTLDALFGETTGDLLGRERK